MRSVRQMFSFWRSLYLLSLRYTVWTFETAFVVIWDALVILVESKDQMSERNKSFEKMVEQRTTVLVESRMIACEWLLKL